MRKSGRQFKPEELKHLLHSYWLVPEQCPTNPGIECISENHRPGLEVVVALQKGASERLIKDTLFPLGIDPRIELLDTLEDVIEFDHGTTIGSGHCCILKMLALPDRTLDFGLLVPFAFELARRDLGNASRYSMRRIEGGFLLSVLVMLKFGKCSLLEIMKDAIRCAENGQVWGTGSTLIPADPDKVREFLLVEVPPIAGAYLGLGRQSSRVDRMPTTADKLYPPSEIERKFSSIAGKKGTPYTFPRLHCAMSFDVDSLGTVARNFAHWYHRPAYSIENDALRCLWLRLRGLNEEEIQRKVTRGDAAEYMSLLTKNHIAVNQTESGKHLRPSAVMASWKKASDALFKNHRSLKREPAAMFALMDNIPRNESAKGVAYPVSDRILIYKGKEYTVTPSGNKIIDAFLWAHQDGVERLSTNDALSRAFGDDWKGGDRLRDRFGPRKLFPVLFKYPPKGHFYTLKVEVLKKLIKC